MMKVGASPAYAVRAHEVLSRLPEGPVKGAEIGVFAGSMSSALLRRQDLTLLMVDSWKGAGEDYVGDSGDFHAGLSQDKQNGFYEVAKLNVAFAGERAVILRQSSLEAAATIDDESLDFVFIDADHSYEGCKSDIEAWFPKLKPGGLLSGHDYANEAFEKFGVKRAVDEFGTPELGENYTWFMRKGSKMNKAFDPTDMYPVSFSPECGCNVTDERLMDNVAINIRRQLPQVKPHMPNNETVALVCGGPSLAQTEKELVELYWSGAKVVCVNGSYQWCIDRNIKPSAVIMIDARAFNARFLSTPVKGCRYLLASQCHPDAFELCKDREVMIWHAASAGDPEVELLKEFYFDRMYIVTGGTTVAIRAVWLLRMLGFQTFHAFGLDSCWMGDVHHAYPQKENDLDSCFPVWLRPQGHDEMVRQFFCSPWQMKQAEDWETLIRTRGDDFKIQVHGDGLIAAMMKIAAELGSVTISKE